MDAVEWCMLDFGSRAGHGYSQRDAGFVLRPLWQRKCGRRARQRWKVQEGADILDVGGESSRPPMYGEAVEVSL